MSSPRVWCLWEGLPSRAPSTRAGPSCQGEKAASVGKLKGAPEAPLSAAPLPTQMETWSSGRASAEEGLCRKTPEKGSAQSFPGIAGERVAVERFRSLCGSPGPPSFLEGICAPPFSWKSPRSPEAQARGGAPIIVSAGPDQTAAILESAPFIQRGDSCVSVRRQGSRIPGIALYSPLDS